MTGNGQSGDLLRRLAEGEQGRVTYIELFFDLVFVFAITQLSHALLAHLSVEGAIETAVLFMAVWWVWIYTSWTANWLDPERTPVRLMLLVLMLAGLVMSASIPDAFAELGVAYAAAHVFIQVGRTVFMLTAVRRADDAALAQNFRRILVWLVIAGIFWMAGAFADRETRLILWLVAIAIEYAGPSLGFYVPGLGGSSTSDWNISGGHMAERCALFIIIALGESILITGATFAEMPWSSAQIAAFLVAFIGTVAMWWIYFDTGQMRGTHVIEQSSDPGRRARLAYTYLHLPIVAGIVVCAVSDELILAHPSGHLELPAIAVILGGPALFLIGVGFFKKTFAPNFPLSHMVGLGLLLVFVPVASYLEPLSLGALAMLALLITAIWETISLRGLKAKLSH
jgi:low temperature requirement protein LtrA